MNRRTLPDSARRGWCPGLARPMPTGDGLLARIHPPLGVLTLAQARSVVDGARRYGNGHLDLTARGNLQIRGVSEATTAPLAALLGAAGLGDTRTDGGPQRLTLTGPLAGREFGEGFDIAALARAIEAVGRDVPGLPAKTLVAVGGVLDEADWSVVPVAGDRVAILPTSEAVPAMDCLLSEAPSLLASLLTIFTRTGRRRMRDVTAEEWAGACASRHCEHSEAIQGSGTPSDVADPWSVSLRPQGRGARHDQVFSENAQTNGAEDLDCVATLATAVSLPKPGLSDHNGLPVLALDAPFGRCTADAFTRLIAVAEGSGAPEIRLSPTRGVVLLPARPEQVDLGLLAEDFIIAADDPRRAVAACTGAPACASGTTPTLRDAARVAEAFRPFAATGLAVHVSGCAKGCARPGPADLTLVGRAGEYAIIVGGSPGDPSLLQIPIDAALERLGRASTVGLAAAFAPAVLDQGRNRRPA